MTRDGAVQRYTPRGWKLVIVAGFALAIAAVILAAPIWWQANRHEVIPGEVYRSGQPSDAELVRWIDELELRSIVRIKRGPDDGRPDRLAETRIAAEAGVELLSLDMSAQRLPSPMELLALVDAVSRAPRPTLLHCESGIDRSGLAAATSLLMAGESPERAREQFGVRYGYPGRALGSPLPGVLDAYGAWLAQEGLGHRPEHLRRWVRDDYIASYYEAGLSIVAPIGELDAGRDHIFQIRVTNRSPLSIPLGCDERGVQVSIQIRERATPSRFEKERRNCLEAGDLAPGASEIVHVGEVRLPHAGTFDFVIDLVDEAQEVYFQQMGSPVLQSSFRVVAIR